METNLFDTIRNVYNIGPAEDKKIVIFSDLHLGNGGSNDDFIKNGTLFSTLLERSYYDGGYHLVLNGDIEELQKFSLNGIRKRWKAVFTLFDAFNNESRLYKTAGNHDEDLLLDQRRGRGYGYMIHECLSLTIDSDIPIYIFHGHQSSLFFTRYNALAGLFVRYLAKPFYIKNLSVAYSNHKKFITEQRVYRFSSRQKIISIIGHTHRPLFESISKIDDLRFRIEQLCRSYPDMTESERELTGKTVFKYKKELHRYFQVKKNQSLISSLYSTPLLVPNLFNAGCGIGKSGMTCIEIREREIALVHWFDSRRSDNYLKDPNYECEQIVGTTCYKVVLKKEPLSYIFARINLLA